MIDKNEALFVVRLTLPFGKTTVAYDELALLIAEAKTPGFDRETASDAERDDMALRWVDMEEPLLDAVRAGELEVINPFTQRRLGPPFSGRLFDSSEVSLRALRKYLESIDGFLEVEAAPEPQGLPVGADETDFDMVATRQQLIDAFGKFTGMSLKWFVNLNDSPKLKAARKYTGQGGRSNTEPLFCPYEVMQWLANPKLKKGKPLSEATAWRLLKSHFPKVYNHFSIGEPDSD